MGQTPVSDVFSGQGADLLYVLAVCQNRVEICLIQLPVSHHEIVDGFTVAVIQITIEFGVFVYNALAAEKFCVVRLVIRLAALLEKRLFQIYRLCLGSCALPAVRSGFLASPGRRSTRTVQQPAVLRTGTAGGQTEILLFQLFPFLSSFPTHVIICNYSIEQGGLQGVSRSVN